MSCAVSHTTKNTWNTGDFCVIGERILGAAYALSIVLVGDTRARTLNREHRHKTYTPNVLSFPLTREAGEIVINIPQATREAHRFDHTPEDHVRFLLIHGCLHLKGYTHGSTMAKAERIHFETFRARS